MAWPATRRLPSAPTAPSCTTCGPLGYWEAKDTADDLDTEIKKKFLKGYPQDSIIFENSTAAVLIQDRVEVMRCSMTDTRELERLLNLFFGYERQEIALSRRAVAKFQTDLPATLDELRKRIDAAHAVNPGFKSTADTFLAHAKETINPTLTEADVREMLIQHILTEDIFTQVFNDGQYHRENNIAKELSRLEDAFFNGAVKRETMKAMQPYYAAIRANAPRSPAMRKSRPSSRQSTKASTRSTTPRPPTGWAWSIRRARSSAS